jgi:DNA-directed RNA polymerase sigma subunit (sigma70/sigma32)
MNESMNKFLRPTLEKELGRAPTNEEISRRMDIPVETLCRSRHRFAAMVNPLLAI